MFNTHLFNNNEVVTWPGVSWRWSIFVCICAFWMLRVLSMCSAVLPYLLPLLVLLSWTTAGQILGWKCRLHIPWEHCYVLCSPETVRQEFLNYTNRFLHLQSVVSALLLLLTWSLGKPQFLKQFLILLVEVISLQSSILKCIVDSRFSIVCEASWSSLSSVTVKACPAFYRGTWMNG